VNFLFVADVYGSPGRRAVRELLPDIVSSMGIDFTVVNVENAAAGFGVTKDTLEEMKTLGVDAMTIFLLCWNSAVRWRRPQGSARKSEWLATPAMASGWRLCNSNARRPPTNMAASVWTALIAAWIVA
jgi:hypothetical protein